MFIFLFCNSLVSQEVKKLHSLFVLFSQLPSVIAPYISILSRPGHLHQYTAINLTTDLLWILPVLHALIFLERVGV